MIVAAVQTTGQQVATFTIAKHNLGNGSSFGNEDNKVLALGEIDAKQLTADAVESLKAASHVHGANDQRDSIGTKT